MTDKNGKDFYVTIDFDPQNPGTAIWSGPQTIDLFFFDQVTITLSDDFPPGSTIQTMRLERKSSGLVVKWPPPSPDSPVSVFFGLSANSDRQVVIQNIEAPKADDPWMLALSGCVGGSNDQKWKIDPELINRAGGGPMPPTSPIGRFSQWLLGMVVWLWRR